MQIYYRDKISSKRNSVAAPAAVSSTPTIIGVTYAILYSWAAAVYSVCLSIKAQEPLKNSEQKQKMHQNG